MPPLSSSQKSAITTFINITGTNDKNAQKWLKSTNYKLNEAVDAYYVSSGGSGPQTREPQLDKLFEKLKGAEDSKDTLDADSTMSYFQELGASLEDASLFLALEIVQAENIGSISREGFVKGWAATSAQTTLEGQKQYFETQRGAMSTDPELFKKVYRHAFVAGKEPDQRALSLENATIYWDILFKAPGFKWIGRKTGLNWLEQWKAFLAEKWTRSVSRDMWQQIQVFAVKSTEDETLSFYSPEASWPGVIDDFVTWYKAKSAMDIDA